MRQKEMTLDSNLTKIPVYFMPGMAANPSIFEYIQLDEDTFDVHYLSWKTPVKSESLETYALRMCQEVVHQNPVLIGVSFGGILVQEMAKLISVKRLIIISSVKSYDELPHRMKFARQTKAYKILPTGMVNYIDQMANLPLGNSVKKRIKLYKKYMFVSDKYYLDWSIENIVCWKQKTPKNDLIHIHGDKDTVFPIEHIKDCIIVPEGTHIMIINKYRWFNKHLPNIIKNGKI